MTVWMHKGGDILLRYDFLYYQGSYLFIDGNEKLHKQPRSFFRQHCVYIGRF